MDNENTAYTNGTHPHTPTHVYIYIYPWTLPSHKESLIYAIWRELGGTGDHVEWDKPSSIRQIFHVFAHLYNLDLKWW
jgi:hypothetical protein